MKRMLGFVMSHRRQETPSKWMIEKMRTGDDDIKKIYAWDKDCDTVKDVR